MTAQDCSLSPEALNPNHLKLNPYTLKSLNLKLYGILGVAQAVAKDRFCLAQDHEGDLSHRDHTLSVLVPFVG